jgi:hypothetical protein
MILNQNQNHVQYHLHLQLVIVLKLVAVYRVEDVLKLGLFHFTYQYLGPPLTSLLVVLMIFPIGLLINLIGRIKIFAANVVGAPIALE